MKDWSDEILCFLVKDHIIITSLKFLEIILGRCNHLMHCLTTTISQLAFKTQGTSYFLTCDVICSMFI